LARTSRFTSVEHNLSFGREQTYGFAACAWNAKSIAFHKPTGFGDENGRRTKCIRTKANIDLIRRAEMSSSPTIKDRQRAHVERMLQRAEKRSRQAQKIVEKWKAKLMELDKAGVAAKQARLWQKEHLQEIG
jgi:hypothetical protein